MANQKTIGLLFVDGWADWEFGLLAGSAPEWFGARVVALSPGGMPVRSIGGLHLTPERDTDPASNTDLDCIAAIGSDNWAADNPPDAAPLLKAIAGRQGIVGGICAATLALARAGLFADVAHVSNGREWINDKVPDYPGAQNYRDVPHAVADGNIISAPGSAPGTFALAFLRALYPEKNAQIAEMRGLFAKEYAESY